MTPEQEDLILAMVFTPGDPAPLTGQEFLDRWGADDGAALGRELFDAAVSGRVGDDLELALIVMNQFGRLPELGELADLAHADWHERHEDVATMLAETHAVAAVAPLRHLVEWVPDYLDFDENRALAVKALWGLWGIPGPQARAALGDYTKYLDEVVAETAQERLAHERST